MTDSYTIEAVHCIPMGEYVKRKPTSKKVYKLGAYDAETKRYSLEDCDDICNEVYVKSGTMLVVGFTY